MSIDNKREDWFYLILTLGLCGNEQRKWDQLRNKEIELLRLAQQKYTD